jgi:hypothetical protein
VPGHRAATQHAVARARFAGVIGMQTQLSPGWCRIAAFGLDYGFISAYLGLLTLVGMLGRIVVALPTDIATPAGRVVAQLVIFAVLTVPVTVWFAGWEATPAERPRASGCSGYGSSPRAAAGWHSRGRWCARR